MLPGRAVVTSSTHTTSEHATLVTTVLVGLEGAVRVTSGGRLIASGPVVVVPPMVPHASSSGAALTFFYSPTTFPGSVAAFSECHQSHRPHAIEGRMGAWLAGAVRSERAAVSDEEVLAGLSDELAKRFPSVRGPSEDPRVSALFDVLGLGDTGRLEHQASPPNFRQTILRLARAGGITRAHLSALFVRDTGVQMRTYQRWLRLSVGLRNLMTGHDATSAAHIAGFADLAHFSRACRSSMGSSPSQFVRQLIRQC
jgi:AraC-like DNA-binding protein